MIDDKPTEEHRQQVAVGLDAQLRSMRETNQGLQQRLEAAQQAYNAQGRSLTEATALLAQIRTVVDVSESCGGSDENDKVSAYIGIRTLFSHAPAQPAAQELPWLDEEGCIVPYPPEQLKPAEPEPSTDFSAYPMPTNARERWLAEKAIEEHTRAEAAEAQLAAVRSEVEHQESAGINRTDEGLGLTMTQASTYRRIAALLTAASPGAGEKT